MTRLNFASSLGLVSLTALGLVLTAVACSSSTPTPVGGAGAPAIGGAGAPATPGAGGPGVGSAGQAPGGAGGPAVGSGGASGAPTGGAGANTAGANTGGMPAAAGAAGAAGAPAAVTLPPLVTSAPGAYWKTDVMPTDSTAAATVTVNDTAPAQKWEGFGAAFNELGWTVLTTPDLQNQAIKLLFSATDGANFAWGRIPMGASDYAKTRYTLDDPAGTDPAATAESARPAFDTTLAKFSLSRDSENLIPYIKAAQAVKSDLHFWASPWTPPVGMKTGYKTSDNTKKPSFFDGGTVANTAANLTAYAQYYTKFVQGYKDKGINVELVSPQNEPGYDQNYPSALWDKTTYTAWIGQYLGPAMKAINVKVMLGTLSNNGDSGRTDLDIATAVLADPTAKGFVTVAGVQWGVLAAVVSGTTFGGLPIWATEHKCGNYPWNPTGSPKYVEPAPNDQAYGVESWGYIRDAIGKGKVTSYSAWNMVLDKMGYGNDTTRNWAQDTLLVSDGGMIKPTPAYYVFRHLSQYVMPNATVVGTTGGDALAFKNPDGSLVAVMFNSGAANAAYVVAIGGKKLQFAMPANGWATVKVKP